MEISIHPPHAGRDRISGNRNEDSEISIHPPHAGRDCGYDARTKSQFISIHPPHAGRDKVHFCGSKDAVQFQSTRPMRGGTFVVTGWAEGQMISIHPPHAGRDCI